MMQILTDLKNKPLGIKAPIIVIFFLVCYLIVSGIANILYQRGIEEEIKNFKFDVNKTYFETRFNLRNFRDRFMIIELKNSITEEQFKKIKFTIKDESISAEQLAPDRVKINFNSAFRKGISSSLIVDYLGKKVFIFNFNNSDQDEEDAKRNPISEPDKY